MVLTAGRQPLKVVLLIFAVDAAREISRNCGGDDLTELFLESGACHLFDALLFKGLGLFGIHLEHGLTIDAEHLDSLGHQTDFILAVLSRHLDVVLALGHGIHGRGHAGDRFCNEPCDKQCEAMPTMTARTETTMANMIVF